MKYSFLLAILVALTVTLTTSCKEKAADDTTSIVTATPTGEQSANSSANTNQATLRTPDQLESLYPETLLGIKRESSTAQQSDRLGAMMTTSEAMYMGDGKKLALLVFDTGGDKNLLSQIAPWYNNATDMTSERGLQQVTTVDGQKAYERENKDDKSAQLLLVHSDRFLITFSATGMELKDLKEAYREVAKGL